MRRSILTILVACGLAVAAGAGETPLKVVMLSGAWEYKSQEALPVLQKHLEKQLNVQCTLVQARKAKGDDVPGIEALADADVMVVFMRRQSLKGDQLKAFRDFCEAGKPVVGIRTASHAVQTWLEFDKLVLGGNYRGHYGKGLCKVTIAPEAKAHPILAGVQSFESQGSLYKNQGLAAKDILLWGEAGGQREPVAWTHAYKGGRVFYTSLGHPADFADPAFLRLLTNALRWVTAATSP